ncbi:MAG: hypothetical protein AB7V25_07305 [Mangrovibacterium sp.]
MKTINFRNESKGRRFTRVALRGGAVIFSVILLSFTVSAQGLWKQLLTYNSFGKMAMLMVSSAEAAGGTEVAASENKTLAPSSDLVFAVEPAAEGTLEVKDWMTDDVYFGAARHLFDKAIDEPLELEPWMTNEAYFASRYAIDKEKEMEVKPWMLDRQYWRY